MSLAKLSLSGANFLILDEPTNHLDPETQTIIADTKLPNAQRSIKPP